MVERIISSQSTPPVCLWEENPNRLVSLWDMLQRYAFSFYEVVCRLEALREHARINYAPLHPTKVWDHQIKELLECLPEMRKECDALAGCGKKQIPL